MYKFNSINELLNLCKENDLKISEVSLKYHAFAMNLSEQETIDYMSKNLQVMKDSVENGMQKDLKSTSGLSGGMAYKMNEYVKKNKHISGDFVGNVIASALAVSEGNACMGKIVAAPTAGSSGIVPATLLELQKKNNLSDLDVVMGLFNAAAIGYIIARNASISGAEGGCQAECGSASAMASSAMVEMLGGTPEMCADALANSLKSLMGLVCDPVAGLVEEPCIIRNVSSAVISVATVDMIMAGLKSIIPADEVIQAMDSVSKALPESLRETAGGGIAASETAQKISKNLLANKKSL